MRFRPLYILEPGAFNYWLDLPRRDKYTDGKTTFAAAWWTGRYRRLVGVEFGRHWWRWF